ncbi:MAG: STAS domain-containing protein [Bacillota bacterium]
MDIQIEINGGAMVVRLSGEIDLAVADTLRNSLESELDNNPQAKNIVLNLDRVSYIDSSGLGVMLGRYRRISRHGGRMFIVGAAPQVRKVLDLSGLLNIMQECPSETSAMEFAV